MHRITTRLTFANVISMIALFIALSGTAFAVGKATIGSAQLKTGAVTSSKIKSNAVTGAKVKNGSLTGADVKLSSLGQVPSAASAATAQTAVKATSATNATNSTNATTAASAKNADTVGGMSVRKVFYAQNTGAPDQTLFDDAGLRIVGTCAGGNIDLVATTTKNSSTIYSTDIEDTGTNPSRNVYEADLENQSFIVGSTFSLLAGGNGNVANITFEYNALDGKVVTGTLVTNENGATVCEASGTVTSG